MHRCGSARRAWARGLRIVLLDVGLIGLLGLASACGSSPPAAAPGPDDLRAAETEVVRLLNETRTGSELPALARDDDLDAVARAWSEQLVRSGELAHNPSYAAEMPAGWTESGENVGHAGADRAVDAVAAELHAAWLASPTHRANLLDPAWTTVGVAVAWDETSGYWVTQDFAGYP